MPNAWLSARKHQLRNMVRQHGHIELVKIGSSSQVPETLLLLRLDQLFRTLDVQLVLDVGARVGEFANLLRKNGYAGDIISFEPTAASYAELSHAAERDGRWQALNVALGSQDGEAEINVSNTTQFSSFHAPNAFGKDVFGDDVGVDHVEVVKLRRLDTLLPELRGAKTLPRTFLKMDTQGFDLEVLRGATNVLGEIVALQSEVSVIPIYEDMPGIQEAFGVFRELGFALSGVFPVTYDSHQRIVELDCILVADGVDGHTSSGSGS